MRRARELWEVPAPKAMDAAQSGAPLSRRDFVVRYGAAALMLSSTVSAQFLAVSRASQTSRATQVRPTSAPVRAQGVLSAAPVPVQSAPTATPTPRFPPTYWHAAFTVDTPEQVRQAAALGIQYTICYVGTSWAAADPTTPLGSAMQQYGLKTLLNLENPFLSCANGRGRLDAAGLRALVARFKDSPLVAGYWTKDDDCGDERAAVQALYQEIRALDPNPAHIIMPGFSDAGSVSRNYLHGQGDVLAFYPYLAYSRGPAYEVPRMLRIVRERTPPGAQAPPFIGIYQAFGAPPRRPVPSTTSILDQVRTYLAYSAVGIAGFGWEADIESHVVKNDPQLQQAVGAVTNYLIAHPPRHP